MLHNAVVLYRHTITFGYIVSTNQSRLRIPTDPLDSSSVTVSDTDAASDTEAAITSNSTSTPPSARDAQPALVIGRNYITERDSAPVQYNGIV